MITLTNPESRPLANEARLVSFTSNTELKYAQAIYEAGYVDAEGIWNATRKVVVEWSNDPNVSPLTFNSLVLQVPACRDLKSQLEQWAVAKSKFAGVAS